MQTYTVVLGACDFTLTTKRTLLSEETFRFNYIVIILLRKYMIYFNIHIIPWKLHMYNQHIAVCWIPWSIVVSSCSKLSYCKYRRDHVHVAVTTSNLVWYQVKLLPYSPLGYLPNCPPLNLSLVWGYSWKRKNLKILTIVIILIFRLST